MTLSLIREAVISTRNELLYITNSITDLYFTKDFTTLLKVQYEDYVTDMYSGDRINEFHDIVEFYMFSKMLTAPEKPSEHTGTGMGDLEEELAHICIHAESYTGIVKMLAAKIDSKSKVGNLLVSFLNDLVGNISNPGDLVREYDRYMGDIFPASKLIRAVYAYAMLSGLLEYYYLKELKNG